MSCSQSEQKRSPKFSTKKTPQTVCVWLTDSKCQRVVETFFVVFFLKSNHKTGSSINKNISRDGPRRLQPHSDRTTERHEVWFFFEMATMTLSRDRDVYGVEGRAHRILTFPPNKELFPSPKNQFVLEGIYIKIPDLHGQLNVWTDGRTAAFGCCCCWFLSLWTQGISDSISKTKTKSNNTQKKTWRPYTNNKI